MNSCLASNVMNVAMALLFMHGVTVLSTAKLEASLKAESAKVDKYQADAVKRAEDAEKSLKKLQSECKS